MPAPKTCPRCGAILTADAPDGLCPACLMQQAMGEESTAGASSLHAIEIGGAPGSDATADWSSEGPDEGRAESTAVPPDDPVRVRYFGDYEVGRELGRGGMGVVFKARQISLNRPVALKMIRSALLASDEQKRRLRIEAEAVAALDHPQIVPIFEVGEHEGHPYFAMKLVDGAGLDRRLGEFAGDFRAAAGLVATAAEAVHHAHRRGILHRDLKPANILVDAERRPHVTDFGLAKRIEGDGELTGSGAIVGTPAFMAPEQAAGSRGAVTTATDVYGLGSVLYGLLAGRPPFVGDSVVAILDQVRERAPEPPSKVDRRVPRDLEVICLKCLEKDPRRRYDSAEDLAEDLRRWLAGVPIRARPVGPLTRLAMWCRRRPAIAGLAVAALVLSLLVAALAAVNYAQTLAALEQEQRALQREKELRGEVQAERDRLARQLYLINTRQFADAYREADMARLRDLLDAHLPAEGRPDFRGWEWFYFDALAHAELMTLGRFVETVSWSPNGRLLAATRANPASRANVGYIVLFDAETGREVRVLRGQTGAVHGSSWSPDSRFLATAAEDGTVRVWRVADGEPVRTLGGGGPSRAVWSVSWSPDGRRIAAGGGLVDPVVRVFDAATGDLLATLDGGDGVGGTYAAAWSPDSRRLATAHARGVVLVRDVDDKTEIARIEHLPSDVHALAWSTDGQRLATAGEDGAIRVHDLGSGRTLQTFKGHDGPIWGLSWSPDGWRLASASDDRTARVWDTTTGAPIVTLRGHMRGVNAVCWSPDGLRLATAGNDGRVRLWDPYVDPESRALDAGPGTVAALCWDPAGHRLASAQPWIGRDRVLLWDVDAGTVDRRLSGTEGDVKAIVWSAGGRRVAASLHDPFEKKHAILLWDLTRGGPALTLDLDEGPVHALGWASGDRLVAVSGKALHAWTIGPDGPAAGPTIDLGGDVRPPFAAISPGGARLAVAGSDRRVRVLDTGTGREPRVPGDDEEGDVRLLAWGPEGRRLASLSRWPSLGFLPSGEPRPEVLRVRDVDGGAPGSVIRIYGEPVAVMAWHPGGRRLATTGDDGVVTLWDVATGQPVLRLSGPAKPAALAWSADGRRLAASGPDGRITVWDAPGPGDPSPTPSANPPSGADR